MASPVVPVGPHNDTGIWSLSNEVLIKEILIHLPVKTILNFSETCTSFNMLVLLDCDVLWKTLAKKHFLLDLKLKEPFKSYFDIYKSSYKFTRICIYMGYKEERLEGIGPLNFLYHWGALMYNNNIPAYSLYPWYMVNYKPWMYSRHLHGDIVPRFSIRSPYKDSKHFNSNLTFVMDEETLLKTWGLTEEDITKFEECDDEPWSKYYDSYSLEIDRAFKALLLKHSNDKYCFQKEVLSKCYRDVRTIDQHYHKVSIILRANAYYSFTSLWKEFHDALFTGERLKQVDRHPYYSITNVINDCFLFSLTSMYFSEIFMPQDIGVDYMKGEFNRTGERQLREYCVFMARLKHENVFPCPSPHNIKIICDVALRVYKKHREECKTKLITVEQFWKFAMDYIQRGHELSSLHKNAFSEEIPTEDTEKVSSHHSNCMKYIEDGNLDALEAIRLRQLTVKSQNARHRLLNEGTSREKYRKKTKTKTK